MACLVFCERQTGQSSCQSFFYFLLLSPCTPAVSPPLYTWTVPFLLILNGHIIIFVSITVCNCPGNIQCMVSPSWDPEICILPEICIFSRKLLIFGSFALAKICKKIYIFFLNLSSSPKLKAVHMARTAAMWLSIQIKLVYILALVQCLLTINENSITNEQHNTQLCSEKWTEYGIF